MGTCFLHENRLKREAPGPHGAPCILLGAVGTEATSHPCSHSHAGHDSTWLSQPRGHKEWNSGKDGPPRAHWATADFCEVPGSPAQLPGRPGSGPTHSRSGPAEKHSGTGVWLADPQGPQGQNNCPTACTQERPAFFPGLSPDGRHESRGPRTWELLERGGDQDAPPCNTHISLKE